MGRSKAEAAAELAAARVRVARFETRYGGIVVTFTVGPHGPRGTATFSRFPDVAAVQLEAGGVFKSPNGVNLFQLRFPAGKSSPATRNTAALDVMEPLATSAAEFESKKS